MIERLQLSDERLFADMFNSDYNEDRQKYVKYRIVAVRKEPLEEARQVRGLTPLAALRATYAKGKLIIDNYDVVPGSQYSSDEIAYPLTDEAAHFVASNHVKGLARIGADWAISDGHAAPRDQVKAYSNFWVTYLNDLAKLAPKLKIIVQLGSMPFPDLLKLMERCKCAGFYYQYLMGDQPQALAEHEMWWNRAWQLMSTYTDRIFILGVKLDELRTARTFPYERLLTEFLSHRGPKHYLQFDLDRSKTKEGWNPVVPPEVEDLLKRMRR